MEETRAELQAAQAQKFRALIRYAGTHAPYYATIIRERRLDVKRAAPAIFRCSPKPF